MRSLMCVASVLVLLAVAGWVSHPAGAASDDETPSIKKIMQTLHKGAKAPLNTVKASLKGDSPDWETVQKDAEVIAKYGAFLPKNEPPKGEKAAYEKLAKAYEKNAKALEDGRGEGRAQGGARRQQETGRLLHSLPQGTPADLSRLPCRIVVGGAWWVAGERQPSDPTTRHPHPPRPFAHPRRVGETHRTSEFLA